MRHLLGLRRVPSPATVTRFFRRFTAKTITETVEPLFAWCLERLPVRPEGYTLDLDSRVVKRYGQQEGALKGYNPKKHGRPSHHPLFAVLAEARTIAHVWLRSGNTGSARGAVAFLAEVQALLANRVRVTLVRAGSGFVEEAILAALEAARLPYAIAATFRKPLQVEAQRLTDRPFAPGLEVTECTFKAQPWTRARRVVVVREELAARPEARGRRLLAVPGYRFHAVVTTLTLPAEEAWRTYNGRADSENRIKELKHAFGADGFCSQRVASTEAALRFICFLYHLLAEFQRTLGQTTHRTLMTVRTTLFACGAILGPRGRQALLRLSRANPWQARFLDALQRLVGGPSNCNAMRITEAKS